MSASGKGAIGVGLAFFFVHVLLLLCTFDVYDLEETEYGNVAVAILDGQLSDYGELWTGEDSGGEAMSGAGRRRRTVWSLESLVLPFFVALGPTMLSLKLAALAGGACWAALWFLLARRLSGSLPIWMTGLLFVLPIPLVQRAAISATSITAHLGSSLWHAASLLAVLLALEKYRPKRRWVGFVAGGLLGGWGLYCSLSAAPLLLGVVALIALEREWKGLGLWCAALVPGLLLVAAFQDSGRAEGAQDIVTFFTGLSAGSAARPEGDTLGQLLLALGNFAGFGRVSPESLDFHYLGFRTGLPYLSVLTLVVVGSLWTLRTRRRSRPDVVTMSPAELVPLNLIYSLGISALAYFIAWLVSGLRLDPTYFDGMRYLLPLAPLPALLVLTLVGQLPKARAGVLVLALLHGIGFILLARPAVFPAPWSQLKGYEPWVMKAQLKGDLDGGQIPSERLGRWARWAGSTDGQRYAAELGSSDDLRGRHSIPEAGLPEYWRGFGFGLALRADPVTVGRMLEDGMDRVKSGWLVEGLGLAHCYVSMEQKTAFAEVLRPREALSAGEVPAGAPPSAEVPLSAHFNYGLGRASFYCGLPDRPLEGLSEAEASARERGRRDAWALDYAAEGARGFADRPQGFKVY